MTTNQFNTLVQMIATLSARVEEIADAQKNFITKEDAKKFATKKDLEKFATKKDLERFATKKDLEKFATKKELERFATKADLKNFATKLDLSAMAHILLEDLGTPLAKLDQDVQHSTRRLQRVEKKLSLA